MKKEPHLIGLSMYAFLSSQFMLAAEEVRVVCFTCYLLQLKFIKRTMWFLVVTNIKDAILKLTWVYIGLYMYVSHMVVRKNFSDPSMSNVRIYRLTAFHVDVTNLN